MTSCKNHRGVNLLVFTVLPNRYIWMLLLIVNYKGFILDEHPGQLVLGIPLALGLSTQLSSTVEPKCISSPEQVGRLNSLSL